ncbi:MAG TPA: (d)CMP kinase [Candidatus Binataceae bacterium]|nr:(d)CMP kinase [Candidatus Binataceae bacterium]
MTRTRPIIAIDGPGGAGKSTVARKLAKALAMTYLNTGAMYRAVAVAIREAGIRRDDPKLEERIAPILKLIRIDLDGDRVSLNGHDISSLITENEINDLASVYSALPSVRARMRELQHATGKAGGVVMEGRDIGTVVFPDAEFKFYLDADSAIRAERRYAELSRKDAAVKRDEVLRQLAERDQRDRMREIAPLKVADDAVVIDVSKMSIDEVVSALKERIQRVSSPDRA